MFSMQNPYKTSFLILTRRRWAATCPLGRAAGASGGAAVVQYRYDFDADFGRYKTSDQLLHLDPAATQVVSNVRFKGGRRVASPQRYAGRDRV